VQQHARALLEKFNVTTPPVPVEQIAEDLGIRVVIEDFPDDTVSGFYFRRGAERVIGVNGGHAKVRRRFTLAHELGHVLLTAHDDLHIDRSLMRRDARSTTGSDWKEVEANSFAAELLLPMTMLNAVIRRQGGLDLDNAAEVKRLAATFGVSTQALLIRLGSRAIESSR
jgi:Zn-dependent peptidase ImmA (M78 family)